MSKTCAHFLFVSLLFSGCVCSVPAQSGRAHREKTNNPGVEPSSVVKAKATAIKDAGPPPIPLLVMLSRARRLVMLPPSNQTHAERIAKSLRRDDRLSVKFEPEKIKLEDAQKMLSAGARTYILLLRFEEFIDSDDYEKSCRSDPEGEGETSYKMEYTLLGPEAGAVVKKRSIQTFFSRDPEAKPLFKLFVTNCVNTSRHSLEDSAVQCMTRHVLTDLYDFATRGEAKKR